MEVVHPPFPRIILRNNIIFINELIEVCTLHPGFVGEAEREAISEWFSAEGGEQEQSLGSVGLGHR